MADSAQLEHGVDHQALHLHGSHRVDEIHDDDADPRRLLHVPDTRQRTGYKPSDDDRRTHGVCELKVVSRQLVQHSGGQDRVRNGHRSTSRTPSWPWACPRSRQNCGNNGQIVRELARLRRVGGDPRIAHLRHHLLDLADGAATLGDLGVQHNPMPVTSIVAQADRADRLDVQPDSRGAPGDPRQRRVHHG